MNLTPALPLRVSKLVHDADFYGSVRGYLSRNAIISASGTLVVPASSSVGDAPTTVNLNVGVGGTYAIVGNIYKCFFNDPLKIRPILSGMPAGYTVKTPSYVKSFTSDGVLIDSISDTGHLNIYGAAYIELSGGTCWNGVTLQDRTISVNDVYISAGTSLI